VASCNYDIFPGVTFLILICGPQEKHSPAKETKRRRKKTKIRVEGVAHVFGSYTEEKL